MPADGLQIYGNIFNPLEPTQQVGPAPTDPMPDEAMSEELPLEEEMPLEEPMQMGGMVSPESARYFGPEGRCMNCIHFSEPGSCEIVSGQIDPEGICSLFTQDSMDEPMPDDMPMPELPAEEPEGM